MEGMNMKFVEEIFGMIKEIREDQGFKEVTRNCSTGRNWISDKQLPWKVATQGVERKNTRIILKITEVEREEDVTAVGYYCVYHNHGRFKRGKDAGTVYVGFTNWIKYASDRIRLN